MRQNYQMLRHICARKTLILICSLGAARGNGIPSYHLLKAGIFTSQKEINDYDKSLTVQKWYSRLSVTSLRICVRAPKRTISDNLMKPLSVLFSFVFLFFFFSVNCFETQAPKQVRDPLKSVDI